jgi:GT2 family glycosyltransferase/2-polyprenyl-3-methyl-5-hydroxy-6-metoxy-1,4-benzoquinol methylase/glycosyltransferase involved in cell wall biosynthesis
MSDDKKALEINSVDWWDNFFECHWENNSGREQTGAFMAALIKAIPFVELTWIKSSTLNIVDWGGALGDGVNLLSCAFPEQKVSGIDVSESALIKAHEAYPAYSYFNSWEAFESEEGLADITFNSNCLEHFTEPFVMLEEGLAKTKSLYLVLVPYKEQQPICESHCQIFDENSFPRSLAGFQQITNKVIDVDQRYWSGQQLLMIYAAEDYIAQEAIKTKSQKEMDKWNAVYAQMILPEVNSINGFDDEFVTIVDSILTTGSSVLEAGCGGGGQSIALARTGKYNLTLMDFSEYALDYAKRYFEQESLPAGFVLEDVFTTETSTSADLVFNAGVLEHYQYEEQVEFVKSMANRAQKLVMILVPNTNCYWYWLWRQQSIINNDWPYGYEVPASNYKDIIEDAGLSYAGKFYFGERWTQDFIRSYEGLDPAAAERILSFHENNLISPSNKSYMVGFLGIVGDEGEFSHLELDNEYNKDGRNSDRQTAALGDALANQVRMLNQIAQQEGTRTDMAEKLRVERQHWDADVQRFNQLTQQKDATISELVQHLSGRDDDNVAELKRLHQFVVEREQNIDSIQAQRSAEQGQYASEVNRLETVVTDRDMTVTSLTMQLSANQTRDLLEFERLNAVIVERDNLVNSLNEQMLLNKDSHIAECNRINAIVADKDITISDLNEKLIDIQQAQQQKLTELHDEILGTNVAVQGLSDRLVSEKQNGNSDLAKLRTLCEAQADKIEINRNIIMKLNDGNLTTTSTLATLEASFEAKLKRIETLESSLAKLNERVIEKDNAINVQDFEFEQLRIQYDLLYNNYESANKSLEQERKKVVRPLVRGIKRSLMFWQSNTAASGLNATKLLPKYQSKASIAFDEWKEEVLNKRGHCYDVILFPVIDWHFRVQRPQHLVRELAASGHRAFYLTTTFFDSLLPDFKVLESPAENVFIVQLGCPEGHPNIYNDTLDEEQQEFLLAGLIKLCTSYKLNAIANIVDLPFWGAVAEALPSSVMVYDCMDHHAGFTTNSPEMLNTEDRVLNESDLVISTSALLAEKLTAKVKNTLIRNAGEIDFFAKQPVELKINSNRPIVGYYGAICDWFDIELVVKAAKAHPEWDFALVGNVTDLDISAANKMSNIQFYGEVPYADLPGYLYAFDICTIPFMINDLTLCTNPVKVYEYLAAGKPVVATAMPELKLIEDVCHVGEGHDEYIKHLAVAMAESKDQQLQQSRAEWAKNHDWSSRALELNDVILPVFPKVSIVVLTYNNLDFTKACLHSLQLYTDYPNWELIIVDNASSDDSPEYLKEYETLHDNAKVILNDDNLGFSAGNNVGLEAATGDYLVILNNDTYVTRGWLNGLIKALDADSQMGIVGPVTNNIGNEAKIEIGYADMDAMAINAEKYTDAHANQLLHVNTVAFFCVAFSRSVFEKVGLMDEDFGVGFFEDDDYCNRVHALGLKVAVVEDVFVHHHLSASFDKLKAEDKQKLFEKNKIIYEKKWGEWSPHTYR